MSDLFKVRWRRFGTDRHCVVRAVSSAAALDFVRDHYGTYGPDKTYQVGPISESNAARLRCDKLNADQLSLV